MTEKKIVEVKKQMKKKRPSFKRTEEYRHAKLKDTWRKPRGKHSKQRMHEKARGALPNPGYGTPADLRGFNRDGFKEVVVNNVSELSKIDPKTEVAVIASGVGTKKKKEMGEKAKEMKVKFANLRI